ncbi:MAG TPA: peroxiredoxin [Gammaproteobacteria bacterium]
MSKWLWLAVPLLLLLGSVLWTRAQPRAETLLPGMPAPDFALPDAQGTQRRLGDYRGEWLLLYFYPRADTPVCTQEACAFRDGYLELRRLGVQVVGISVDAPAAQQAFATKYRLPFPLLSDAAGTTARAYGSLWSLGPLRYTRRHSFLIDAQGRIARVYRSVDADTHYREVLDDLATVTHNTGE